MEFSEFTTLLSQWLQQRPSTTLDCWIDDGNARIAMGDGGARCSIEVLDPYDASDPQRLDAVLLQGGACLACACEGALAIDPQTHCLVLLQWLPGTPSTSQLLGVLEGLANQRAALLSLLPGALRDLQAGPRATFDHRPLGV